MAPRKRKTARTKTVRTGALPMPPLVKVEHPRGHGGSLYRGGVPGNKGGGRPKEEFRAFLRRMRDDPDIQDALEAALKDPDCKGFASAWKVMTEYDTDRPETGVTIRIVRDEPKLPIFGAATLALPEGDPT